MSGESESWTDEDDVAVAMEVLPDGHPSLTVDAFRAALQVDHPAAHRILAEGFVTPESASSWGDFSAARAWAESRSKISTTALCGEDAPDVAYVRLVYTDELISPNLDTPEHAMVTLVWRPEIEIVPGGWRIHAIGEPVDPRTLPRTANGEGSGV